MAEIARYYDAEQNPEEAGLPGVPLRDITQDEFDGYPDYIKASIDAQPMYRKTKPRTAAKPDAAPPPKADKE